MAKTPGAGGMKPGGAGGAGGALGMGQQRKPPMAGGFGGMQPPGAPPVNVAGAPPPQLMGGKGPAPMAKPMGVPPGPQGRPGAPGLQGLMGGGVDRNKLAMMMRQRPGMGAGPMGGMGMFG